jgi:hypothetical protein
MQHLLFVTLLVFVFAGCDQITPKMTRASPVPRDAADYLHYTSSGMSKISLEFDYPGSWVFSEEKIQGTDIVLIGLGDPRLLTVPTRAPHESHGTPSDFGSISILIQPLKTNLTLESHIDAYIQGHRDSSWIKALKDDQLFIGENIARVLEYQINPIDGNGYTSVMFERSIFFAVKDQICQIMFFVAEKDRGGEFERGYEYFLNSLKIVP